MFTGTDIVKFFQENSALAVFLTVAIGFWIGKFRFGNFSLGIVTSVLLVGVVVGQMNIRIPEPAKTLFFLMFLFSIGYSVGPQFFRGLRKDGLPQVGFAVVVCVMCLLSVWGCAIVMGYDAAQAAGLLAGSQTMSAVIGAATDTIHELPGGRDTDLSVMPVCYAVTYIYGTAGSAWVLGTLGPRLLGGVAKVKQAAKQMESQMGDDQSLTPGFDRRRVRSFSAPSAPTTSGSSRGGRYASSSNTWPGSRRGFSSSASDSRDRSRIPPRKPSSAGATKSSSAGAAGSSSKRKHGSDARSRTRNWSTSRSKRCRSSSIKKG